MDISLQRQATPILLSVIELLGYPNLRPLYERLGYRVLTEFSVRKAISLLRRERPAVIVADFYFQPDFRDRVSNLESLLATAQSRQGGEGAGAVRGRPPARP
jgi:hypothetical protein